MKKQCGLLINNEWKETGERIAVRNPYTGEMVAEVCSASDMEAAAATDAAEQAFSTMRTMPGYEKAALLDRTAALILEQKEQFAQTICMEAGKPIAAARAEVDRSVSTFHIAAQEATRLGGQVLPLDITPAAGNRLAITRRFPIGPVLAITPFNFPLNLAAHKIAPALAAGNTVVHKPASATPLTALLLGDALIAAGMPAGALNVVPCAARVAEIMVRDDRFKMVSFTGSPDVGWRLKNICGKKKVALELGGNAAAVVEPDADIDYAVERCAAGGYAFSGQVCISLQRIYVHESLYPAFKEKFIAKVRALKTGDPLLADTVVGPLITAQEVQRVHQWVGEARELGGQVLAGGSYDGTVYMPTVLDRVPPAAQCVRREVFGPVTVLFPYGHFNHALDAVNDSAYGLQAGVFTRDVEKIFRAFNRLDVGGVIINDVPTYRVDNFAYGGVKDSGFGREGVAYAMEEMTEIKVMVLHNGQ